MTILTHDISGTYKAQIRSSLENGFRQLYTGSCTSGPKHAAAHVVTKYFGDAAARSIRQVTDKHEIVSLIGNFMDNPKRKQVFQIWTFTK